MWNQLDIFLAIGWFTTFVRNVQKKVQKKEEIFSLVPQGFYEISFSISCFESIIPRIWWCLFGLSHLTVEIICINLQLPKAKLQKIKLRAISVSIQGCFLTFKADLDTIRGQFLDTFNIDLLGWSLLWPFLGTILTHFWHSWTLLLFYKSLDAFLVHLMLFSLFLLCFC